MTTYEYLSQIKRNDAMIENELEEIERLRTIATNITVATDSERVQSSGDKDRIGKIVSRIADMEKELSERVEFCYTDREKIIRQMESLKEVAEYQVLFFKFVSGMPIERIAERINYSDVHCYRIYKKALKSFEDKFGALYLNVE